MNGILYMFDGCVMVVFRLEVKRARGGGGGVNPVSESRMSRSWGV